MHLSLVQADACHIPLSDESVQCIVTSPPYFGQRTYTNEPGTIGLEQTPAAYIGALAAVFRECFRVLNPAGTLWINIDDTYSHPGPRSQNNGTGRSTLKQDGTRASERSRQASLAQTKTIGESLPGYQSDRPAKNLLGIPARLAFAIQDIGYLWRAQIIWHKPNTMPDAATDRPTRDYEPLLLFSKSARYYYNAAAVSEPAQYNATGTRNRRSIWSINTAGQGSAHSAAFPPELARDCILAGSRPGDTILDPFTGTGTAGVVAYEHHRDFVGLDLSADYLNMARERTRERQVRLFV